MDLAEKVLKGDIRAAARLISLLEDGVPEAAAEMDALYPHTGRAAIIGVTGAPGTGKSSLVNALLRELRKREKTVGVIAIDPSSAATGGAMLGDRVRMQEHSSDPGVFIRSLATRGWAGGLSRAALGAVHVLDALGKDCIFLETVGAGQVEIDIATAADTTLVVLNPGAGDDIQTLKAGILETADIFVINKADRDGAGALKADLETMPAGRDGRKTPVALTNAIDGAGIEALARELDRHRDFLTAGGRTTERRKERLRLELMEVLEAACKDALAEVASSPRFHAMLKDIMSGAAGLRQASDPLVEALADGLKNRSKIR